MIHAMRLFARIFDSERCGTMADHQKRRRKFWIAVVVVAVLLGYPLSMGPAAWLVWQDWTPEWSDRAYRGLYFPILHLARVGPKPVYNVLDWYVGLWHKFGVARFVWKR